MSTNYKIVMAKIKKDQVLLLDGGNGNELKNRGQEMDTAAGLGPIS